MEEQHIDDLQDDHRLHDLINSINCIINSFMKKCNCMGPEDKLRKDIWLENEVQETLKTIIKSKLSK